MKSMNLLAASFLVLASLTATARAEERSFQAATVEISGTKFWLPSSITVKKGDLVKIHVISKIGKPNDVHGFTIEAFKVVETTDGKGKDLQFVADKAGIFPIKCHLHPAHIGGQLIVLE